VEFKRYHDNIDWFPCIRNNRQYLEQKAEFHLDASRWISSLSNKKFSFGTRIHGNLAAVIAGVPCVILAHDSRVLELAKYHKIPYIELGKEKLPNTINELYKRVDFTGFNQSYRT